MNFHQGTASREHATSARYLGRAEQVGGRNRGRSGVQTAEIRRSLEDVSRSTCEPGATDRLHLPEIELLPAAVYVCDARGVIVDYNHSAADLWGRSPAKGDARERHCGFVRRFRTDGTELPRAHAPMAHVLATGTKSRDVELTVERSDGSRRTILVNASPVHDDKTRIIGAIAFVQDVTVWKEATEALRQTDNLASLQRFVADVAHSYCNIFSAISANLAAARRREQDANVAAKLEMAARIVEEGIAVTSGLRTCVRKSGFCDAMEMLGALELLLRPETQDQRTIEPVSLDRWTHDRGGSALLVDDDPTTRAVAGDALATLGLTVYGTECGDPALEILRSDHPLHIMIVNLGMMPKKGFEVLREARAIRPELRVLIITGHADLLEGLADWGRYAAILRMPFRVEELAERINQVMAHRDEGRG